MTLKLSKIEKNVSLKPLNTFGLEAIASYFATYQTKEDLDEIFASAPTPWMVIGGGSNMLFTASYSGTVIKCTNCTISHYVADDGVAYLTAGAGREWDTLCSYAVEHNLYGCENLSYIPGTVGASGVQNIGAYGAEAKDIIHSIEYYNTITKQVVTLMANECKFGYRDSIFKGELRGVAVILSVTYRLSTVASFNLEYGNLSQNVAKLHEPITLSKVREAVIATRKERLPDPKELGNGGSFFKNPVVSEQKFLQLQSLHPSMPYFVVADGYKIPAAWMIDRCGWKGHRENCCGVYEKQPLVLVNYGGASGSDVYALAQKIIASVKSEFGVTIEPEIIVV